MPSTAHRLALLAALSLLFAGCATPPSPKVPTYAAPTGVPTAKLVMRGSVPAGDAYGVVVYDDADLCKGPRIAGVGTATRAPTTVPLAAGALTTVDFMHVKANRESCLLRWSFTPVAGKSYLVNGIGSATGCRASLLDASNPDAIVAAAGSVRRNEKGNACIPMAQARSITTAQGGQDQGAAVLRPGANADDLKDLIPQ